MRIFDQKRRTPWPAFRAGVCLLLAGLILYNPFIGLCHLQNALSYEKMARNRATVGASELQNAVQSSDLSIAQDAVLIAWETQPSAIPAEIRRTVPWPESDFSSQASISGIWFRPPPID